MDMNAEPLCFHGSNPYHWDTLEFPLQKSQPNSAKSLSPGMCCLNCSKEVGTGLWDTEKGCMVHIFIQM